MLRTRRIPYLMLSAVLVTGCGGVYDPSEEEGGRVEAEDVQKEMKDAVETTSEYVMQELDSFAEESRAKFEEWRSSLKEAVAIRSSTHEGEFQRRADDLLKKIDLSEKNLEDLKQTGRENWEKLKIETEELISQIEKEYQELFK